MNTDYFITNIKSGDFGRTGVSQHKLERHFCEAMVAVDISGKVAGSYVGKKLLEARWYHRPHSSIWHCCVWVSLPTSRGEDKITPIGAKDMRAGLELSGGASAPITYGGNAQIISFQRAINAAGIEFIRPEIAHDDVYTCNINEKKYFEGVVQGLMDNLKINGFDVPEFTLVHTHP